jgi:hypothetical protein
MANANRGYQSSLYGNGGVGSIGRSSVLPTSQQTVYTDTSTTALTDGSSSSYGIGKILKSPVTKKIVLGGSLIGIMLGLVKYKHDKKLLQQFVYEQRNAYLMYKGQYLWIDDRGGNLVLSRTNKSLFKLKSYTLSSGSVVNTIESVNPVIEMKEGLASSFNVTDDTTKHVRISGEPPVTNVSGKVTIIDVYGPITLSASLTGNEVWSLQTKTVGAEIGFTNSISGGAIVINSNKPSIVFNTEISPRPSFFQIVEC